MSKGSTWQHMFRSFTCGCESADGHEPLEYELVSSKTMVDRFEEAEGAYQLFTGPDAAKMAACANEKAAGFLGWWAELALILLVLLLLISMLLIFISWWYYRKKYIRILNYIKSLHHELIDLAEHSEDARALKDKYGGLEDLYKHGNDPEASKVLQQESQKEYILKLEAEVAHLKARNAEHFDELQALQDALEMLRRKAAEIKKQQRARVETEIIREKKVIGPDGKPMVKQEKFFEETTGDEALEILRKRAERQRSELDV
eukprot:Filipodium_phascolosomae@DN6195_c0_g1_i1.p1